MSILEKLKLIRSHGQPRTTFGISDALVERFAAHDNKLVDAIEQAAQLHEQLLSDFPDLLRLSEMEQIQQIQDGLVNFYAEDAINPYVSLTARGPWIITLKGAVLHDSGGYGMLGFGHSPQDVIDTMAQAHVMANVMTPNLSQLRLVNALKKEPFSQFLCLNSGSESVTAAARISDVNAKIQTDPNGAHAGKPIKIMALAGGFHGRTDRPAQYSDSCGKTYRQHLASFRNRDNLITVEPNNIDSLKAAYAQAEQEGVFVESLFVEPVMGEGNPGEGMTPEFYAAARELTIAHGSLLLVDSIQAGLRAHGCLSVVDYPGFENLQAPDMETYSKALNAGQYPLSVLAMTPTTAELYRKGIYGNTMTTNPRAMDVACHVLSLITPEVRNNIQQKGREFVEKLNKLADQLGGAITKIQGTGLLFSCEVSSDYKAYGHDSLEEYLRLKGIGVIHGGENSLRFTPHFAITSEEVDLVVAAVADAIENGPKKKQPAVDQMAKAG